MSFLGRRKKIDLQTPGVQLGLEIEPSMTVSDISKAILAFPNYKEEFVKEMWKK